MIIYFQRSYVQLYHYIKALCEGYLHTPAGFRDIYCEMNSIPPDLFLFYWYFSLVWCERKTVPEQDSINYALTEGKYCVYATVDANDGDYISKKIALRSQGYQKHLKEGDLVIVNSKSFYDSLLLIVIYLLVFS
jgi:hypothetical protein